MKFDVSKVYTAVNADELKPGSKIIVSDNISDLKKYVEEETEEYTTVLRKVESEALSFRFRTPDNSGYALAYLIEPPKEKKLKVSDLKVGDILKHKEYNLSFIVTGIDYDVKQCYFNNAWLNDNELKDWEKTEE